MREVVSKHEAPLLVSMRMEVYVDVQVLVDIRIVHDGLLYGPNRRLIKL